MEQNIRERRFEVDTNFDGWRLDQFLVSRLTRVTRMRAIAFAKSGNIELVPPRRVKPSTRLKLGDLVIVREYSDAEALQDDEVVTLYEDEFFLLINKPAGMLVHETASVRQNTVTGYLERCGREGAEPTHRIDKETSGVLVCGKSKEVVKEMRQLFATTHPEKWYRALVEDSDGRWLVGDQRTLDTPLGSDESSLLSVKMGKGELRAITHAEVLRRFDTLADLAIRIETGRQHQIRIHLALFGTAIAADKLYGFDDAFFMAICSDPDDAELNARLRFPRHALHAHRIRFESPMDGVEIDVTAPLPEIWKL